MKTIIINAELCTGCHDCLSACADKHAHTISHDRARLFITAFDYKKFFVPSLCFHCQKPECMKACDVFAIHRDAHDAVIIDTDACIGCGHCVRPCPYGMIQKDPATGKAFKCDLCGGNPACVTVCKAGALTFVENEGEAARTKTRLMKYGNELGTSEMKRNDFAWSLLEEAEE